MLRGYGLSSNPLETLRRWIGWLGCVRDPWPFPDFLVVTHTLAECPCAAAPSIIGALQWGRTSTMTTQRNVSIIRLLLACVVIISGAYWAGARWGQRQPIGVGSVQSSAKEVSAATAAARDAALTDEESINVRVYRQVSPAVANILTKATEYDFFMDPVPVEGAGSGFVIDEKGYILTNFHVVQEAQSIEVVLGDQSRYPAKFIGADQRNDVALVKIHPNGKHP